MSYATPAGGGGDPFALPGHLISPGDLGQKFDFAQALAANHLRRAYMAAEGLPPAAAAKLTARAEALVMAGAFAVNGRYYESGVEDPDMVHVMLWANLRATEPTITLAECGRLVTEANRRQLRRALWRAWGYDVGPKPEAPTAVTPAGAEARSTGAASSSSSAASGA